MSTRARGFHSRLVLVVLAASGAGSVVGCGGSKARGLSIGDFAHPPEHLKADVVEMSPEVLAGPEVEVDATESVERSPSDGAVTTRSEGRTEIGERLPDGTRILEDSSPLVVAENVDAGQAWPVDALVGQINGRPLFADQFFEPIADQLVAMAALPDRAVGREQFLRAVRGQFKATVDSELIVAEAESQLSAEQQQGLLAWLRSMQEATIAERGGTRSSAEASLEAERTQTMDDFLQERRDVALYGRLVNQRVEPRAIVSWREVLQAYDRDFKVYNPPAQIRVGLIRFDSTTEAAKVERMKALVAEGKTFAELAKEFEVAEAGLWKVFEMPAAGVEGLELSDAIRARLKDLEIGRASEPLQARGFTNWYAVISIDKPASRSVYDRELQIEITERLKNVRRTIERQRYIETLRSRWVTDDISEMEERLIAFALERYWR